VLPAMVRLRGGSNDPQIERTVDLGALPDAPEVSIVIAVRAADRIEHQLAQFARDPEIAGAELVFVAAGGDPLHELAAELAVLYELPFRLVLLSKLARRPRALNLGVSQARGDYVTLLSGDVLPDAPGWLGALRAVLDAEPEIAAVAPKLLHEDGSIAHAGTEYLPGGGTTRWQRAWPFAGLARDVPAANCSRPVLAASDVCLMTTARLFTGCGGFSELYLGGDEGIDLSLRLAERGGRTWYVPAAELYNLDRPTSDRPPAAVGLRFNDWLLDWRWGTQLTEAAAQEQAA
jgi:O-antigen biosynthesis protein